MQAVGRPHLAAAAVALVVAGLAVAGCGSSYSSGSSSTGSTSTGGSGSGSRYGSSGQPASSQSSGGARAAVTTRKGALGTYLVDGTGRTLYLFKRDTGSASTCSGACAQAWPRLTSTGAPRAGAGVNASLLSTTKRADGTTEVDYAGHPLYLYAGDSAAGQTNGQGLTQFGAAWYVLDPAGQGITR